jgi:hypothetical protein
MSLVFTFEFSNQQTCVMWRVMITNSCGFDLVNTGLHGLIHELSLEILRQVWFCIHRRTIFTAADETLAHFICSHSKLPQPPKLN